MTPSRPLTTCIRAAGTLGRYVAAPVSGLGILIGVIAVAPILLVLRAPCRCFAGDTGAIAGLLAGPSTLGILCANLDKVAYPDLAPRDRGVGGATVGLRYGTERQDQPVQPECKLILRDRNPIRLAGEEIVR